MPDRIEVAIQRLELGLNRVIRKLNQIEENGFYTSAEVDEKIEAEVQKLREELTG